MLRRLPENSQNTDSLHQDRSSAGAPLYGCVYWWPGDEVRGNFVELKSAVDLPFVEPNDKKGKVQSMRFNVLQVALIEP